MTFKQWLLSELPNPRQSPYTTLYLISLVCLIAFVVISSILLKNKSQKTKRNVMMVFALTITVVAVVRKVVNFVKTPDETLHDVLWILLSRPGCAISGLLATIAVVINKKWAYTFASLIGLLCGTAFFAIVLCFCYSIFPIFLSYRRQKGRKGICGQTIQKSLIEVNKKSQDAFCILAFLFVR